MQTRVDVAVLKLVLSKPFLGIEDLCIILGCSKTKAFSVKNYFLMFLLNQEKKKTCLTSGKTHLYPIFQRAQQDIENWKWTFTWHYRRVTCLVNPMDREAWQATVSWGHKSWT